MTMDLAPLINATAQQSRFKSALVDPTSVAEVDLKDVNLSIGQRELLDGTDIVLKDGLKYGLVGPNGSGKSSILHALSHRLIPGIPESLRIFLMSQTLGDDNESSHTSIKDKTVLETVVLGHEDRNVALKEHEVLTSALASANRVQGFQTYMTVVQGRAEADLIKARRIAARRSGARGKAARGEEIKAEERVEDISQAMKEKNATETWELQAQSILEEVDLTLEVLESSTLEQKARKLLHGLGFSNKRIDGPVSALSGGWRSRMVLAMGLLVPSDLLLLDEPSNFMDLQTMKFLEYQIKELPQTVVLVSHDQTFMDEVVDRTICLRRQKLVYFDGSPSSMLDAEEKKRLGKTKQKAALDKKHDHIQKGIVESRQRAKASGDDKRMRQAVSKQKKLDESWGDERSAKGTRFKLNRDFGGYHDTNREEIVIEAVEGPILLKVPSPQQMKVKGDLVHLEKVGYRYKGRKKDVVSEVAINIGQNGRYALIGRNGQGKTTLARLIIGELQPTSGTVQRHAHMKMAYFSQHSVEEIVSLGDETPLEWFMLNIDQVSEGEARGYLGSWGLQGRTASHTPIQALSGGQKVRLALARITYEPADLLVLDEVTTHLDDLTIRALAQALRSFQGTIVLITHDRWFSRRVIEGVGDDLEEEDGVDAEAYFDGTTYLVDKGKVRMAKDGMTDYEKLVEKRLVKEGIVL